MLIEDFPCPRFNTPGQFTYVPGSTVELNKLSQMAPQKHSSFLQNQESTYNEKAIFKRFLYMTIVSFRKLSKIPL